jgi:hypothetical protein
MRFAPSRSLAVALFAFVALVLVAASSCTAHSQCTSCNPVTHYCTAFSDATTGCKDVYRCVPLPDKCASDQTCNCLMGESNPPGHFLSCTWTSSEGFTVWDDAVGC